MAPLETSPSLYRVYNLYNLYNFKNISELETLGPIDQTPGIPGSDNKPVWRIFSPGFMISEMNLWNLDIIFDNLDLIFDNLDIIMLKLMDHELGVTMGR